MGLLARLLSGHSRSVGLPQRKSRHEATDRYQGTRPAQSRVSPVSKPPLDDARCCQLRGGGPIWGSSQRSFHNSPVLVADPKEPRFVLLASRLDSPDFSCALHLSGDGGRYWVPAEPVPQFPPGAEKCCAPELGFDRKSTPYYLFVGLQGIGQQSDGSLPRYVVGSWAQLHPAAAGPMWASTLPTGRAGSATSRLGPLPRKDPRSFALPFIRRPTWPAASTSSWLRSVGA